MTICSVLNSISRHASCFCPSYRLILVLWKKDTLQICWSTTSWVPWVTGFQSVTPHSRTLDAIRFPDALCLRSGDQWALMLASLFWQIPQCQHAHPQIFGVSDLSWFVLKLGRISEVAEPCAELFIQETGERQICSTHCFRYDQLNNWHYISSRNILEPSDYVRTCHTWIRVIFGQLMRLFSSIFHVYISIYLIYLIWFNPNLISI